MHRQKLNVVGTIYVYLAAKTILVLLLCNCTILALWKIELFSTNQFF